MHNKKLFFISCLLALASTSAVQTKGNFLKNLPLVGNKVKPHKHVYYELVHQNIKPDANEFYVNSIFTIKGRPKVNIARSKNKRAGPLYQNYVSYGIGDYISTNIKIVDINTKIKEVIVLDETDYEFYGLTMGYGIAVSRLYRKPGYEPKEPLQPKKFGKDRVDELTEENYNETNPS